MRNAILAASVAMSLSCGLVFAHPEGEPTAGKAHAAAKTELKATQGNKAAGTLNLTSEKDGVRIKGSIRGLTPNAEHGFHVHEKGDCSAPDASSAGGHFNPDSKPHGKPGAAPHHLGDITSIRANASGVAAVDVRVTAATLRTSQAGDIVGKSIVVHEKPDDYTSQPAGNSGNRIACGVIQ